MKVLVIESSDLRLAHTGSARTTRVPRAPDAQFLGGECRGFSMSCDLFKRP